MAAARLLRPLRGWLRTTRPSSGARAACHASDPRRGMASAAAASSVAAAAPLGNGAAGKKVIRGVVFDMDVSTAHLQRLAPCGLAACSSRPRGACSVPLVPRRAAGARVYLPPGWADPPACPLPATSPTPPTPPPPLPPPCLPQGTLTVPVIDFALMRRRVGVTQVWRPADPGAPRGACPLATLARRQSGRQRPGSN